MSAGRADPVRAGRLAHLRLQRPTAVQTARRAARRHARRTQGQVYTHTRQHTYIRIIIGKSKPERVKGRAPKILSNSTNSKVIIMALKYPQVLNFNKSKKNNLLFPLSVIIL